MDDQSRTAPVSEGQELEVEVIDNSVKGDGIAKVNGFIIFIRGGSKGSKVKIRISKVSPRFAIGELI